MMCFRYLSAEAGWRNGCLHNFRTGARYWTNLHMPGQRVHLRIQTNALSEISYCRVYQKKNAATLVLKSGSITSTLFTGHEAD